jgi:hypothetical protein
LDDVELDSLRHMLNWRYLDGYDISAPSPVKNEPSTLSPLSSARKSPARATPIPQLTLLAHAKVHALAVRFGIDGLKIHSARNFITALDRRGDDETFSSVLEFM